MPASDPIAEVTANLDAADKDDEKEAAHEVKAEDAAEKQARENIHEITDDVSVGENVAKLCKEFESWKTETKETLSSLVKSQTESQALIREALAKSEAKPETPDVVAIAPLPEPAVLAENPLANADGPKDHTTNRTPKRKHRFL